MSFQPNVNQELLIGDVVYRIAEHPYAPRIPYGQEGRQATVYQLLSGEGRRALKVFKPRFQAPALVSLSKRLASFAGMTGLQVCSRQALIPRSHGGLLVEHPDLLYAVVMPWIEGPTWMEVLFTQQELTPEQSLLLAGSLAEILADMEQESLAHCDLSGPNLLLPALAPPTLTAKLGQQSSVELVDVEQMFGPDLKRPDMLPSGSSGYAHKTAPVGLWVADADRFAGAVIISEMLGWCDEKVRAAAWGESYFHPEEMHQNGERYQLLRGALQERWGKGVARLLDQAWQGDTLDDCPNFGAWVLQLSRAVSSQEKAQAQTEPLEKPSVVPAAPVMPAEIGTQTAVVHPADEQANSLVRSILTLAMSFEAEGDFGEAMAYYREAQSLVPNDSQASSELAERIINLECKQQTALQPTKPVPLVAAEESAAPTPAVAASFITTPISTDEAISPSGQPAQAPEMLNPSLVGSAAETKEQIVQTATTRTEQEPATAIQKRRRLGLVPIGIAGFVALFMMGLLGVYAAMHDSTPPRAPTATAVIALPSTATPGATTVLAVVSTITDTSTSSTTPTVTNTPTQPLPTITNTPVTTLTSTTAPQPTNTATAKAVVAATPLPPQTRTPTPRPVATARVAPTSTQTKPPTAPPARTATRLATATVPRLATNTPAPRPTGTPTRVATHTAVPLTRTQVVAPTDTPAHTATNTPVPTDTNVPKPREPTDTPAPPPTDTYTPRPAPTHTLVPRPTATDVPIETNTPRSLPTNTPRS